MAANEYHVDFSSGDDTSGDGSGGSPWKTIDKALTSGTVAARVGSAIGGMTVTMHADETLAAALSLNSPSGLTAGSPLWIRGDGTRRSINGDGTYPVYGTSDVSYALFSGLTLENTGSNTILTFDNYCSLYDCILTNSTNAKAVGADYGFQMRHCTAYNCGTSVAGFDGHFLFNHFRSRGQTTKFGASSGSGACYAASTGSCFIGNLFDLDANDQGINFGHRGTIEGNTFIGGKYGVRHGGSTVLTFVGNNIFQDFDGASAKGLYYFGNAGIITQRNVFYNNTDNVDGTPAVIFETDDAASNQPVTDPTGGDWSLHSDQQGAAFPKVFLDTDGSSLVNVDLDPGGVQQNHGGAAGTKYLFHGSTF